jgi:hypothetical protein
MRVATRFCLLLTILACSALLPSTALAAPTNDVPPSIPEEAYEVGDTIDADAGMWSNNEWMSIGWQRCATTDIDSCVARPGDETGSELTTQGADGNRYLRLIVTAGSFEGELTLSSNPVFVAMPKGIIDNGTVRMGVRDFGSLNVPNGPSSYGPYGGTTTVGLRLLPDEYEATAPGCLCEGWGVGDGASGVSGWSNAEDRDENIEVDSFTADSDSATSVTTILDGDEQPYAKVTHDFQPSSESEFLYEATVTIEPLQLAGLTDLRYRRTIDWDIEPTAFEEMVTTIVGNAPELAYVSDDGFATSNPLGERSMINFEGEAYANGPADHGVLFDFEFGALAFGSTKTFKMYYGAAPTRAQMLEALGAVGAETFSLGENSTEDGMLDGSPATFAIAYGEIGGDPVIDPDAPTSQITAHPGAVTSSRDADFEFESDAVDDVTFACKLDAGSWQACDSPVSYSDLEDGNHIFAVRASVDGVDQTVPTVFNWRVTDRPFDLYFDEHPDWWGTDDDAYFVIAADDVNPDDLDYEYSLDGGDFAATGREIEFSDLEFGEHTLVVRADDGDGSTETLSYTWTISDEVSSRFTDSPSELSNDSVAYFEWDTAGPVDGVECRLDGEDWRDCGDTGSTYLEDLYDGEHTFELRAYDGDGVRQTTPASFTWTVDGKRPKITTSLPPVVTTDPLEVTFTSNEPLAELECRIDSGYRHDCVDGLTLHGLDEGDHNLYVEGVDLAGNDFDEEYEFVVQLGATYAVITSGPPHITTSTSATFTFTGSSPGATFECRITDGGWEPCTSPVTYDDLDNGSMSFGVRATKDDVTQAAPTGYDWRITDEPFDLYFNEHPSWWETSDSADFAVRADEVDISDLELTCKLDSGAAAPCYRNFSYDDLADGEHTVVVTATDGESSETLSFSWTISDQIGLRIYYAPDEFTNQDYTEIDWETGGPFDGVRCRLDGGAWEDCSGTDWRYWEDMAEGEHTFEVEAYDNEEEVAAKKVEHTWTIDRTAPGLGSSMPSEVTTDPFVLPLTANEPITLAICSIDGGPYNDCGWPASVSGLANGDHTIDVKAFDRAGNDSTITVSSKWNVGNPLTPPPVEPAAPEFGKLPKKAKYNKTIKIPVKCAAECTLKRTLKIGKKKVSLKTLTGKPGTTSFSVKLSKSQLKLAKAALKKKKSVTLSVVLSGSGKAGKSGSVKLTK